MTKLLLKIKLRDKLYNFYFFNDYSSIIYFLTTYKPKLKLWLFLIVNLS